MPITVRCPKCEKLLRAPDDLAGKEARCRCGQMFQLPELSTSSAPPAEFSSWPDEDEVMLAPPTPQVSPSPQPTPSPPRPGPEPTEVTNGFTLRLMGLLMLVVSVGFYFWNEHLWENKGEFYPVASILCPMAIIISVASLIFGMPFDYEEREAVWATTPARSLIAGITTAIGFGWGLATFLRHNGGW